MLSDCVLSCAATFIVFFLFFFFFVTAVNHITLWVCFAHRSILCFQSDIFALCCGMRLGGWYSLPSMLPRHVGCGFTVVADAECHCGWAPVRPYVFGGGGMEVVVAVGSGGLGRMVISTFSRDMLDVDVILSARKRAHLCPLCGRDCGRYVVDCWTVPFFVILRYR